MVKKIALCLFVLFFTLHCLNCLPVAVGGLILKSSSTKKQKRMFLETFYETNLEREKAGLLPLNLCIAKYRFDKGWANKDNTCTKIIAAYMRGEIDEYGQKVVKKEAKIKNRTRGVVIDEKAHNMRIPKKRR